MNSPQNRKDPWGRLVAAARQAPAENDEKAPYGFATRVAALAEVTPRGGGSLFERFALRAVGVAALLAIGSIVFTLSPNSNMATNGDAASEIAGEDALAVLTDA